MPSGLPPPSMNVTVHLSQWLSATLSLRTHAYILPSSLWNLLGRQVVWLATRETLPPANISVAIIGFLGPN
jgi:hypothetical protein